MPICQKALELLQQGQMVVNEEQKSINGEVKMAVSSEMGRNLICNIPHFLCASLGYIAKHGAPETPEQLSQHNALLYKLYEVMHDSWELYQGDDKVKVKVMSNRVVNDGDIVRRWCVDGTGIAKKSVIDVAEDLLAGRLQRVMTNYQIPVTEMWLVLPDRQMISPAIRLIRDALKAKIQFLRERLIAAQLVTKEEWPDTYSDCAHH